MKKYNSAADNVVNPPKFFDDNDKFKMLDASSSDETEESDSCEGNSSISDESSRSKQSSDLSNPLAQEDDVRRNSSLSPAKVILAEMP